MVRIEQLIETRMFDKTRQSHDVNDGDTVPPGADDSKPSGSQISGIPETFGRYRIVKALGEGAMGAVYLAEDTQLKRQVALKIPRFGNQESLELLERFYREARAAATLRSPNICPVYDVGELDGQHFISMAYIEGMPLSEYINPDKPQSARQIAVIVRKLALALQEAHDERIVHRDLKPANIMIDNKSQPVIMDFGLARQITQDSERLTHSGTLIGSPAYMPPEQVEGKIDQIGPHSDIYSLGVILYEMLTGTIPFQGSIGSVMARILTDEPRPPREIRAEVDPQLESMCLKMMSKPIATRPASMSEVAAALTKYLKSAKSSIDSVAGLKPMSRAEQSRQGETPAEPSSRVKQSARREPRSADSTAKSARATQKSQSPKSTVKSKADAAAVYRLASQCIHRHDYAQAVELLHQLPESQHNEQTRSALEQATELQDEVDFLTTDMDQALNTGQFEGLEATLQRLLELRPGHRKAKRLLEELKKGAGPLLGRRHSRSFDPAGRTIHPGIVAGIVAGLLVLFGGTWWIVSRSLDNGNNASGTLESPGVIADESRVKDQTAGKTPGAKSITTSQAPARQLPDGSILALTFEPETVDEQSPQFTVRDLSQIGRSCFVVGAKIVPGRVGDALQFHGNDLAEVTGTWPIDDQPRTLCVWLKNTRGPIEQNAVALMYGRMREKKCFGIMEIRKGWAFSDFAGGRGLSSERGVDTDWHHHGITYDGKTIRYYFDGQEVTRSDQTLETRSMQMVIGNYTGHARYVLRSEIKYGKPFEGIVDELAMFDRALSASEITTVHEMGLEGQPLNQADRAIETSLSSGLVRMLRHPMAINPHVDHIAVSPDGQYIASGGMDGTARLWEFDSGKEVWTHAVRTWVYGVAFTNDGNHVWVCGKTTVQRIDVSSGQVSKSFSIAQIEALQVSSASFKSDCSRLVTQGKGAAHFYDLRSGQKVSTIRHFIPVLQYMKNGDVLCGGWEGRKGAIHIRDSRSGQIQKSYRGFRDRTARITVSTDGRMIAAASGTCGKVKMPDNKVLVWNADDGQQILDLDFDSWQWALTFTSDNRFLVTGGGASNDGWWGDGSAPSDCSIRIFNIQTGREVHRFEGHRGAVLSLALTPDGRHLVSSGVDSTVRIWKMPDL